MSNLSKQWKFFSILYLWSWIPCLCQLFHYLCEQAEELDDTIFIDQNVDYIPRYAEKNSTAKKLLVGSGDNK